MITNKINPDPDMIPSRFFTECKLVLASPVLYLFNLSLFNGCFPSSWKISIFLPIKKETT